MEQPGNKNAFHNYSKDGTYIVKPYQNKKYVHENGQLEIVVNGNGEVIINPTNRGTYNYYSPDNPIAHMDYDVDPYMDYGNGPNDQTTYDVRKNSDWGWLFGEK